MEKILRLFGGLVILSALAGCINVDDFGEQWSKGTVDAKLEGTWQPTSNKDDDAEPATFIKKEGYYLMKSEGDEEADPEKYLTLTIGTSTFLMVRNEEDNSGGMLRYRIDGDSMTVWTFKKELLQKAVESKQVIGTIDNDSMLGDVPHLTKLDEATLKFLEQATTDEANWEIVDVYKKGPTIPAVKATTSTEKDD